MKKLIFLFAVGFLFMMTTASFGQAPPLGTTSSFALFTAAGAFHNTNAASVVTGDVGTNVGAFTFLGTLIGTQHVADPVSGFAATDVATAYGGFPGGGSVHGVTFGGGEVLLPGIYTNGAASTINGDLVLDGAGDPTSLFIFEIGGALSTASNSRILLTNSAQLCNVYWQVNGLVSLGNNSLFQGTILANGAISLLNGSTLLGRGLSQAGAINTAATTVTNPCSGFPPPCIPTISLTSANNIQSVALPGSITDITYSVGGDATGATVTGLPAGITGSYSAGTFTITGSPILPTGVFNYIVTTTGCVIPVTAIGIITVTPNLGAPCDYSTDINDYTLFAYNELSFKGGSQAAGWGTMYGNIGVNNPAPSNSFYNLQFGTSGYAYMADGFYAVADHVRADAGGSFFDLYANKLNPAFAATIRDYFGPTCTMPIIALASLPVLPFTPCETPQGRIITNAAANLTIGTHATTTILPGVYKDVRINDYATVTFGAGTFDMRNLDMGKHVTIIVDNATILQIDKMFSTNDFLQFGAIGTENAKIYVGACGVSGRVTNFSHNAEIHASYFSPTGWLDIGGGNNLYGHFWAYRISGDANNNVYGPPPTFPHNPCEPLFSSTISTDINDYVLFAKDQLEWKGGVLAKGWGYIYGNIGVMNPSSWNSNNFSLIFGSSRGAWIADGYQAVADFVRADAGSSFYQLFANKLNNNFGADIRLVPHLPVPTSFPLLITLPPLGFTPGPGRGTDVAADLLVGNGATVNFSPPFLYHNVRVNDDAVVTFSGGTFDMWDLSVGKNVTFIVDDATILQIDRTFMNNTDFTFGVGSHSGAKIYVGSFGIASNQKTSFFSKRAEIHANYYAPDGILDLGDNSQLYGHYWARRITGDPNNFVICEVPGQNGGAPIYSVNPGVKGEGIQISIFPNPARESFTLQINNSISQGSILTLQDLAGKEVLHTALQLQEGINNYPVSIAGISQGVYILKLQTGTGVGQTKLIINR